MVVLIQAHRMPDGLQLPPGRLTTALRLLWAIMNGRDEIDLMEGFDQARIAAVAADINATKAVHIHTYIRRHHVAMLVGE